MSNEELAVAIQSEEKDLIPLLWDNIQKLAFMLSEKAYKRNEQKFINAGIQQEDIKQTSYLAFMDAIKGFDSCKGALFTTYYGYHLKKYITLLLRGNTALNSSTSLDELREISDSEEISLYEIIEDETAQENFRKAEETDYNIYLSRVVSEAIADLPPIQRDIIKKYYFEFMTLRQIASELNITVEAVRSTKNRALKHLRKNKRLLSLYGEYKTVSFVQMNSYFKYSPEYFETINRIKKIESKQYLSYGKKQALLYLAEQEYKSREKADKNGLYEFLQRRKQVN